MAILPACTLLLQLDEAKTIDDIDSLVDQPASTYKLTGTKLMIFSTQGFDLWSGRSMGRKDRTLAVRVDSVLRGK